MKHLLPLALLALAACGDKTDEFDFTTFEGGTFQFTTTAVSDGCYDGSFEPLFMPDGADSPSDWAVTTEIPAWADLPATYTVNLPAPFASMEVTVDANGDATMVMAPQAQSEPLALDADNFPNCMVQTTLSATLNIVDADAIDGSAVVDASGFQSDPDNCPVVTADPCTITLDVTAVRN
ncbi:MAG: hypothetical protein JXX28_07575 [Deltaproteobacteria bacterium]|nr:hypothetical protein [Deltaproteobacteria bacterium]